MIEIKFASDNEIKKICDKIGTGYRPELKVYAAVEAGKQLGGCGFFVDSDTGTLVFTFMNEDGLQMIEDGLLRASLSYMYENGAEKAVCSGEVSERMLRRLGFTELDGLMTLDLLHSFLTQGCSSKQ